MNFDTIKHVYFLGVGGIGMSALARYFNAMGKSVSGYDKTQTALTDELIEEGIAVHFEDNIELIAPDIRHSTSDHVLIVYTPAIPKDHSELKYFQKHNYVIKKRSEVLGMITEQTFTIAVAGTHGKTTTSSLIAHILRSSEVDCTAFLGGITQNYGTNLLLSEELKNPEKKSKVKPITVVEADEYDRSFLTLHPDIAVITSVDADHLDIYGDQKQMEESYSQFASQLKEGGALIIKQGIDKVLVLEKNGKKLLSYSLHSSSDYYARKIAIKKSEYVFTAVTPDQAIRGMRLSVPGKHNVENAVAAVAVAHQMNIFSGNIKNALSTFKGVKRRFEYHIKSTRLVYIDDYAHHPEELRACISAVKEMYPLKKITGIFQPHLFTRTRDFANAFARSLELLDELMLLDIYPAREKPIEGITSEMLLEKVGIKNKKLIQKSEVLNEIRKNELEVLVTLGAGDIDALVEPIKNELMKRINKN